MNQVVRLGALVLIARELSPREFGIAAMATAVWAVVAVVTDLALAAAVVQRANVDEVDRSTAFWASAGIGALLALMGLGASGAVAEFYGEPEVRLMFAALAGGVLLRSLAAVPGALLTRAMDFRALEIVSILGTGAGAAAGVGLAFAGAGAWALVANALVAATVSSVLVWRFTTWRPQLVFSRNRLRALLRFALVLSAARLAVGLHRSVDRLLIGRLLGAPALATYAVPATLVSLPASRLVDPVRSVLFPAFSRLQLSLPDLATAWLRVTRLTVAAVAPVLVGLALAADALVGLVLPAAWSDAGPVLQILALAALAQVACSMNAVVLTAIDRTRVALGALVLMLCGSVTGLAIGVEFGVAGAAAGYGAGAAVVAPLYLFVTARALRLRVDEVARALAPAAAGLLALVTSALVSRALIDLVAPPTAASFAGVTFGLALYALVVLRASRELRQDVALALARSPRARSGPD